MKHNRLLAKHTDYDIDIDEQLDETTKKYLKKYFNQPNVNLCKDIDHVHYNNRNINELIVDAISDDLYENVHLVDYAPSLNNITYVKVNDVKLEYKNVNDLVYTFEQNKNYVIKYGLKDNGNEWAHTDIIYNLLIRFGSYVVVFPYNRALTSPFGQNNLNIGCLFIPKGVSYIDPDIFNGQTAEYYDRVYMESLIPPSIGTTPDVEQLNRIYVPEQALGLYMDAWRNVAKGDLINKLYTYNLNE